jgi:hypothetical protein
MHGGHYVAYIRPDAQTDWWVVGGEPLRTLPLVRSVMHSSGPLARSHRNPDFWPSVARPFRLSLLHVPTLCPVQ